MSDTGFAELGDPLTAREYEAMVRYARLGVRKLVANEMGIQPNTVRTFLSGAYRKLGVRGRGSIAAYHKLGWLRVPSDDDITAYASIDNDRLVELKLRHLRRQVDRLLLTVTP